MAESRLHNDAPQHRASYHVVPDLAPKPKPSGFAGHLLALQKGAGNRAVGTLPYVQSAGATQAEAPTAARADHAFDIAVGSLEIQVTGGGTGQRAVEILRANLGRKGELLARYKDRTGRTLRYDVITNLNRGQSALSAAVRLLSLIHSGRDTDPYAQMGLSLIPPAACDDDEVLRILEKESTLARRQVLETEYNKAFEGIGRASTDTLQFHLIAAMKVTGWQYEKCSTLLRHDLTTAEHLWFLTGAIWDAHQNSATKLLQDEWRKGPERFAHFLGDWEDNVRGYFTPGTMQEVMQKELRGMYLKVAKAIFQGWEMVRTRGPQARGMADTAVEDASLQAGLGSWGHAAPDAEAIIDAAEHLRQAWERRIGEDPGQKGAWRTRRAELAGQIEHALGERWLGLKGDDAGKVEALIKLQRSPTTVDQIWLASHHNDDEQVLDLVTKAWVEGNSEQLERQALHPPQGDPRPAFSVANQAIPTTKDLHRKLAPLLDAHLSQAGKGAERLQEELHGKSSKASTDVSPALTFLSQVKDESLRAQVVEAYANAYLHTGQGTALDRFVAHIKTFDDVPKRVDLLKLVKADTTNIERSATAREYTEAAGIGYGTRVLVGLRDAMLGGRRLEAGEDALRRMEEYAALASATPEEVQAVLRQEDESDIETLGKKGYDHFKTRIDEIRSVRASIADGMEMFVGFVGRSLMVAILGPAGLPGLLSALTAYTAGMVLHKGLLGAEYELMSVENLSTLMGEVATFGFDELMIEGAAKAILTTEDKTNWTKFAIKNEAMVQESVKQAGSKLFEKSVQNMIEDKRFPTPAQMASRAANMLALGFMKSRSAHITKSLTVFEDEATRFHANLKSIIYNGPPPKAALPTALIKAFTDLVTNPGWKDMTAAEAAAAVLKGGAISMLSALPVAAALTPHQQADADRMQNLLITRRRPVIDMMLADPRIALAHRYYKREASMHGVEPLKIRPWVNTHLMMGAHVWEWEPLPYIPEAMGEGAVLTRESFANKDYVDMKQLVSDRLKDLDTAMTPKDWKKKTGLQ